MHLCVVQGELLFSVIVTQIGMGATPTHTHIHHTMRMLPPDVSIAEESLLCADITYGPLCFGGSDLKYFDGIPSPASCSGLGAKTQDVCATKQIVWDSININ